MATEPLSQYDRDLSVRGTTGLESHHGDGRRSHPIYERPEGGRAGQAVLRLLRAGRYARTASSDARMDQEDRRHEAVRRRLEQTARDHLRQPEAAWDHACRRHADSVAE